MIDPSLPDPLTFSAALDLTIAAYQRLYAHVTQGVNADVARLLARSYERGMSKFGTLQAMEPEGVRESALSPEARETLEVFLESTVTGDFDAQRMWLSMLPTTLVDFHNAWSYNAHEVGAACV